MDTSGYIITTMAIGYSCKLNIVVFVQILTETMPRCVMGNVCRFSVIVAGGIRCSAPGPGKHYPPFLPSVLTVTHPRLRAGTMTADDTVPVGVILTYNIQHTDNRVSTAARA